MCEAKRERKTESDCYFRVRHEFSAYFSNAAALRDVRVMDVSADLSVTAQLFLTDYYGALKC